jgi:hypothetical protein
MFNPITIPFGAVMLYNVVKLKPGITTGDVEIAIGEMCNTVKNTYGDDKGGFIGGQVFEYTGFVSPEGSFDPERKTEDHIVIITYWNSFEQHEKSHADSVFKESLVTRCSGRACPKNRIPVPGKPGKTGENRDGKPRKTGTDLIMDLIMMK